MMCDTVLAVEDLMGEQQISWALGDPWSMRDGQEELTDMQNANCELL